MPTVYKWQPIADLPDDPKTLTDGELVALHRVWASQKRELIESGALDEFEKRLRREWAIETGIIENVYTLDRGVTRALIEKGIDAALIPHGASNRDSTLGCPNYSGSLRRIGRHVRFCRRDAATFDRIHQGTACSVAAESRYVRSC